MEHQYIIIIKYLKDLVTKTYRKQIIYTYLQ